MKSITVATNGDIVAILNGVTVTVASKDAAYNIGVSEPIPNQYGQDPIAIKDAIYDGILCIYNDDVDGQSCGLHGSLYYTTGKPGKL